MNDPRFVVVGHFCPTDATPFEDSEEEKTAVLAMTRDEAEGWLPWFPDGEVVKVRVMYTSSLHEVMESAQALQERA